MVAADDGAAGVRRRAVLFDAYPHVYAGAQRMGHAMAREVLTHGWSVTVVTPAEGLFTERLASDAVLYEIASAPRALRRYGRTSSGTRAVSTALALPLYWLRLARVLRRLRPDVVIAVDHRGLVLAGPAARLTGTPLVWHVLALDGTRWINWFGRSIARTVVVPSDAVVRRLPQLDRARRTTVIDNVIPDGVRRPSPAPLRVEPVIVTTARLHHDKGLDVLLDALAIVRSSVPDARLVIIGGPQTGSTEVQRDLEQQARALGLSDAVEFAGFVEHPADIVATSRAYVQSSRERSEIVPLAILEAMAVGTPVVATDVGGVSDVVRHGVTGLLVPPEQPETLAAALVDLLSNDALADRLRQEAHRATASTRFTPAGLGQTYAEVLDEAVDRA